MTLATNQLVSIDSSVVVLKVGPGLRSIRVKKIIANVVVEVTTTSTEPVKPN